MSTLNWKTEKLFYQKEDYFFELTRDIQNAKKSIDLETYIFEDDTLGQNILSALKSATERGVKVRLIVDGVGSYFWITNLMASLEKSLVQFKIYHPFLFQYATGWKWLQFDLIIRTFSQLNKRLHRKVCIIDAQIAFVGSFNITNQSHRDIAARVTGDGLPALLYSFEKNWMFKKLKFELPSILRLNDTIKLRALCNLDLANRIRSALKRIWITNAYFVPPLFILKALRHSGQKGVDVRLLVPARSDQAFMKILTETYYKRLLNSHIRIFEYQKKFLHAKSMLIDDWVMVGSSNMNHRSYLHDLEVDVVLGFADSRLSLEQHFEADQRDSIEVKLSDLEKIFFLKRLIGWLLHRLRYWL